MTREEAARVTALLRERFPGRDVHVTRVFGGARLEIRGDGSNLFAVIGSEHSALLAAMGISQRDITG
jgi:hypothetical protein